MKSLMVMQTDFGFGGGCAMRGTCLKVDPELEVFDGNHQIPKFNVASAARNLMMMVPYWPSGTVFVSVVDPGVGTSRRASVAKLKNGSYVVSPDNGSLSRLLTLPGIEAIRVIDETRNRLKGTEKTSIFHGRDLFAYCGARLASGIIDFEGVGEEYPVSEIVRLKADSYHQEDGLVSGYFFDWMQSFGNMETNIPIEAGEKAGFKTGDTVIVTVTDSLTGKVHFDAPVGFYPSFGWVPEGAPVVYNSSDGVLGVGLNKEDFARTYEVGIGENWLVTIRKEGT
ncbi:MAG: SAM-dependent chlorinase/fluorinase [Firmicutes bacterium]|jgi:S-adenosylmethionine hydrolase|nr:SAM-dependent chlorinase/fluorinase [Bacillota bacterium]